MDITLTIKILPPEVHGGQNMVRVLGEVQISHRVHLPPRKHTLDHLGGLIFVLRKECYFSGI